MEFNLALEIQRCNLHPVAGDDCLTPNSMNIQELMVYGGHF